MSRRSSANDPESKPISMAELMARAKEHGHDAAEKIAHSGRRHGGGKDAVSVAELTGEIPKIQDRGPAPADTGAAPTPPPATRDISADAIADRTPPSDAGATSGQAYSQSSGSPRPDPLSGLSADEREREFERYRNFEDVDHDEQPAKKRGLFGRRRHKDHDDAPAGHDVAAHDEPQTRASAATPTTEGIGTPVPPFTEPEKPAPGAPGGAAAASEPITGPVNLPGTWRRPSGPPPSSNPIPAAATGRFPVSADRPLTGAGTFPASPPRAAATRMDADVSPTGPISAGAVDTPDPVESDDLVDDVERPADADADGHEHSGAAAGVAGAAAGAAGLSALRRRRRSDADSVVDDDQSGDHATHDGRWGADDDHVDPKAADKKSPPALTWAGLAGQIVLGLAVGVGLFWGFTELWKWNTYFALVLTVVVVLAMVSLVYALRRTSDLISVLLALAAGLIVTVGPLAILGEWPQ